MTLANKITILRILLIPFFILFLVYGHLKENPLFNQIAFFLFIFSSATDALDGIIARRFKQKTELGSFLDPLADKLLLASAFFLLGYLEKIALGVVILVISREIFLGLGGVILYLYSEEPVVIRPSLISKANTCFQMTVIVLCLLGVPASSIIRYITISIMVGLTATSMVDYLIKGCRMLNRRQPPIV